MPRHVRFLAAAAALTPLLTGCIGSVNRSSFEAEIDARGGGISSELLADALDAVAAELGVDDFETDGIYVSAQTVNLNVRNPADPDAFDFYSYRLGSLGAPSPVRVSAADPIDAQVFSSADVPVAGLDEMLAITIHELDIEDAVPQSVAISRRGFDGGPLEVTISAESPRASGSAVFDADGELIEVRRS